MALSPRPCVALVALVALVASLGTLVASKRQRCDSTSHREVFQPLSWTTGEPGVLAVTNGGQWGQWGDIEFCPSGSFAAGFQLKVDTYKGLLGDDTALNGVRLLCDTGRETVTSSVGPFGEWRHVHSCPPGEHLMSFRLRVEGPQGIWDDATATDMAAICSGGYRLEGRGLDWGDWGKWSESCGLACGVCGIRTRVEPSGHDDDTGLNDVKLYCCV